MDLNLKDRVAVVTGGAAGIGEAIARALAAEGCTVFILDRDATAARKAAAALVESGHQAQSTTCDIGDAAAVVQAFNEIAAGTSFPPIEEGEILLTAETKPYMREGKILKRFKLATV